MASDRVRYCYTVQLKAMGGHVFHVLGIYTVLAKAVGNLQRLVDSYVSEGKRVSVVEDTKDLSCKMKCEVVEKSTDPEGLMVLKPLYSLFIKRHIMDRPLAESEA